MSSLKSVYQSFLAKPNASALTDTASLHYITTLTTINTAAAIARHFAAQDQVLKKKQEKVLNAVASENSVCLDIETTLEFLQGGGAYLPGLDDNFLSDRVVTFPMVSVTTFCPDYLANTSFVFPDPYCGLSRKPDSADPPLLGPRFAT